MDGYVYNGFEIGQDFRAALEEINHRIGFPEREKYIDVEIYVDGKLFQKTFTKGLKGDSYTKDNKEINYLYLMDSTKNVDEDTENEGYEEFLLDELQDIYYNDIGWKPNFIHLLIDETEDDIEERILGINFYFKTT